MAVNGRIAVAVSGSGTNLRALVAASRRGAVPAEVVLVLADRDCPALAWAAEQGIETALVQGGEDAAVASALDPAGPDIVVLAGYLRLVGPGRSARSLTGSSMSTRRCCPRSRGCTRSVTPSMPASQSPA
ncbi:MAG: formyltransferase family protein [Chloroflexota bacterium]